jgi:hypothetical protein
LRLPAIRATLWPPERADLVQLIVLRVQTPRRAFEAAGLSIFDQAD